MSCPAIHKLKRVAFYVMQENVPQREMQSRYDAASLLNKMIKELQFGEDIKKREPKRSRKKGKK